MCPTLSITARMLVVFAGQAGQLLQLTEDHQDRHAGDVPDQHGLGEVVGDPAQAQQSSQEEDGGHGDGQGRRQGGVLRRGLGGERREGARDQQRDGTLRTDHDAQPGAKQRVGQHGQDQGIQAGRDRKPGQFGVGHRRGQGQGRDRQPRHAIDAELSRE